MIAHLVNLLTRLGADCITNSILADIHSSGHPSKQELRLVLKLFNPKYFMPMHGEYRMLRAHGEIAESLGIPKNNIFILDNGDVLTLAKHKVTLDYPIEHGVSYIDGKDINGLADTVMADRRILTEDGMLIIAVSIDSRNNELLLEPTIYNRGIIGDDQGILMKEIQKVVTSSIRTKLTSKTSFAEIKTIVKEVAKDLIYKKTHRSPMIIPIIMSKND